VDAVLVAPVVAAEPPTTELLDFPPDASWEEAYAEDPVYGPYMDYLKDPSRASDTDRLRLERWTSRFHCSRNRLLYLVRPDSIDPSGLLVIPEKFRPLFLMAFHDLPTADCW